MPHTAITVAVATYRNKMSAEHDYDVIRGIKHHRQFDHIAIAFVENDAHGRLTIARHDSTAQHPAWGGAILGAALAVIAAPLATAEACIAARRGDVERARRALAHVETHLDLAAVTTWLRAELAVRCTETCWAIGDRAASARFAEAARTALAMVPDSQALRNRLDAATTAGARSPG